MQITGYKIMDALEALKEKAQQLDAGFLGSIFVFADESKPDPVESMAGYEQVESRIARLQELQSNYNLRVALDFEGERITLERAIKLQGVMGRLKNQWQAAAKLEPGRGMTRRGYYFEQCDEFTRAKDVEIARRQVSREAAEGLADKYAKLAVKLKQLVRAGNAQAVEIDADPALFEA